METYLQMKGGRNSHSGERDPKTQLASPSATLHTHAKGTEIIEWNDDISKEINTAVCADPCRTTAHWVPRREWPFLAKCIAFFVYSNKQVG